MFFACARQYRYLAANGIAFFADAVEIANCQAGYIHAADLESEDLVINGVSMYQCKICLWIVLTEMEFTHHRLNDCCVIVKSMEGHQDYKCKVCDKLHSDRLVQCTNWYFMDLKLYKIRVHYVIYADLC